MVICVVWDWWYVYLLMHLINHNNLLHTYTNLLPSNSLDYNRWTGSSNSVDNNLNSNSILYISQDDIFTTNNYTYHSSYLYYVLEVGLLQCISFDDTWSLNEMDVVFLIYNRFYLSLLYIEIVIGIIVSPTGYVFNVLDRKISILLPC
jgi:hypothetical protein